MHADAHRRPTPPSLMYMGFPRCNDRGEEGGPTAAENTDS